MDYYKLLDLNRNCNNSEIKKAFRKKALIYHPDKAPNDKKTEYENKFKEISQAYNVLYSPEKRKSYDRFGIDGLNQTPNNSTDIFEQMFRNFSTNDSFFTNNFNYFSKLENTIINIDITLEESYLGTEKIISFKRKINNSSENIRVKVNIPIGCKDGLTIIKEKQGNIKTSHISGDLIFIINYKPHPKYTVINNCNLLFNLQIKFGTSLIGTKFTFKHLSGESITIVIDNIINNNDRYVIKNKGLYSRVNNKFGDLIINIIVNQDINLNEEQKKILTEIFPIDEFPFNSKTKKYNGIKI